MLNGHIYGRYMFLYLFRLSPDTDFDILGRNAVLPIYGDHRFFFCGKTIYIKSKNEKEHRHDPNKGRKKLIKI